MSQFLVEHMLKKGDVGYSPSPSVTTRFGIIRFPENPNHGGRRVVEVGTPEEQKDILVNGNVAQVGKPVVAIPTDLVGAQERRAIEAIVREVLTSPAVAAAIDGMVAASIQKHLSDQPGGAGRRKVA